MKTIFSRAAVLLMTLMLVSCDNSATDVGSRITRPSMDAVPGNNGHQYTLVEGDWRGGPQEASGWIDRSGGVVYVYAGTIDDTVKTYHAIYFPDGAVKHKTWVTIKTVPSHFIQVRLNAYEQKGQTLTDVGAKGFSKPVYLFMTYSYATNVIDPSLVRIVYDPENGAPVQPLDKLAVPEGLGTDKYAVAQLNHFSKYAMAMD